MISVDQKFFGISIARRRTRRAFVIGIWCVTLLCGWAFLHSAVSHRDRALGFLAIMALQLVLQLPNFLGGLRPGGMVRPFLAAKPGLEQVQSLFGPRKPFGQDAPLDERETGERDRIHFLAYRIALVIALMMGLILFVIGGYSFQLMCRVAAVFFFALIVIMLGLPQSLILWTEPDMEEQQ
jgi:heme/copper-type cytochrome/quinol oxidase subunit 4